MYDFTHMKYLSKIVKIKERERRKVVTKGWGEGGKRNKCLVSTEFPFCRVKNSREGFPGGAVVKNPPAGASLVAQWLRICLPMQGTQVRALVWEDATCRRAAGPVSHSY